MCWADASRRDGVVDLLRGCGCGNEAVDQSADLGWVGGPPGGAEAGGLTRVDDEPVGVRESMNGFGGLARESGKRSQRGTSQCRVAGLVGGDGACRVSEDPGFPVEATQLRADRFPYVDPGGFGAVEGVQCHCVAYSGQWCVWAGERGADVVDGGGGQPGQVVQCCDADVFGSVGLLEGNLPEDPQCDER